VNSYRNTPTVCILQGVHIYIRVIDLDEKTDNQQFIPLDVIDEFEFDYLNNSRDGSTEVYVETGIRKIPEKTQ